MVELWNYVPLTGKSKRTPDSPCHPPSHSLSARDLRLTGLIHSEAMKHGVQIFDPRKVHQTSLLTHPRPDPDAESPCRSLSFDHGRITLSLATKFLNNNGTAYYSPNLITARPSHQRCERRRLQPQLPLPGPTILLSSTGDSGLIFIDSTDHKPCPLRFRSFRWLRTPCSVPHTL